MGSGTSRNATNRSRVWNQLQFLQFRRFAYGIFAKIRFCNNYVNNNNYHRKTSCVVCQKLPRKHYILYTHNRTVRADTLFVFLDSGTSCSCSKWLIIWDQLLFLQFRALPMDFCKNQVFTIIMLNYINSINPKNTVHVSRKLPRKR